MHHGQLGSLRNLFNASEVAGDDNVGFCLLDMGDLPLPEAGGVLLLQHAVGSGAAATDVCLGNLDHSATDFGQQFPWLTANPLSMLQ